MLDWLWELMEKKIEIRVVIGFADHPETAPIPNGKHHVECDACDWEGDYDNAQSAKRGLRSHQNHCGEYVKKHYEWLDASNQTIADE